MKELKWYQKGELKITGLSPYYLDERGNLVRSPVRGIVRKVSENPVDYVILDVEVATMLNLPDEEVSGLMEILKFTSETQYLIHPKAYTDF